jgi:beta-lactamase class A
VKWTKLVREDSHRYSFTNPLLFIDNAAARFSELDSLKEKLEEFKEKTLDEASVTDVAVYFRDLNTTRWTGISEDQLYDPASMQKVVLLVAYLRAIEEDASIAEREYLFTGNDAAGSHYDFGHTLVVGRYYSVQDLLMDMIIKSGNTSTRILFDALDKSKLAAVYEDLNLPFPTSDKPELISSKIYSRLFRILYSSTYLTRELSEQALLLLSQTEFDKGLRATLPKNMKVAHKFGERSTGLADGEVERQLHDCGIVYYPEHPYFLCVMTKGKDFSKLERAISGMSEVVYEYWNGLW